MEPVIYLQGPPFALPPGSNESAEWAICTPCFIGGSSLGPFTHYPLSHRLYALCKAFSFPRISNSINGALPEPHHRKWDPVIDTLVIIGIVGGAGTSLGLGVPLVSAFFGELFGLKDGFGLQILVLTLDFDICDQRLSRLELVSGVADTNILLAMLVLLFILVVGPTVLILTMTANSFGLFSITFSG